MNRSEDFILLHTAVDQKYMLTVGKETQFGNLASMAEQSQRHPNKQPPPQNSSYSYILYYRYIFYILSTALSGTKSKMKPANQEQNKLSNPINFACYPHYLPILNGFFI